MANIKVGDRVNVSLLGEPLAQPRTCLVTDATGVNWVAEISALVTGRALPEAPPTNSLVSTELVPNYTMLVSGRLSYAGGTATWTEVVDLSRSLSGGRDPLVWLPR